ncbi:MAG: hypothetical protein EXR84_04200 [Gammaproteobacteria bacterium]|nr:hypothetical protein [Gammaproteobacteria bacterium]
MISNSSPSISNSSPSIGTGVVLGFRCRPRRSAVPSLKKMPCTAAIFAPSALVFDCSEPHYHPGAFAIAMRFGNSTSIKGIQFRFKPGSEVIVTEQSDAQRREGMITCESGEK